MSAREPYRISSRWRRSDLHLRSARSRRAARPLNSPDRPSLADVEVLAGTDVDDAWARFEVFEALHHSMQICNPMSSQQLDELVSAIAPTEGARVLDVACGYGELLMRCAEVAPITGIGIDLSPWMVNEANRQAISRVPEADLRWVLGEAKDFRPAPVDITVCIGAEWVWHDVAGTARALAERVVTGGVVVIGAARLHLNADQKQVRETHGVVESVDDVAARLQSYDLQIEHRIDPDDGGWDNYLERTRSAARDWAQRYPGPRAERWIQEQVDWHEARERDREIIGWSVWVARKGSTSE